MKIGQSVRVTSMARVDAIGKILRVTPQGYEVRLPNWQADGVHLDVYCRKDEVETGHGRAKACRCCYCR
jgi:hypothetical protein